MLYPPNTDDLSLQDREQTPELLIQSAQNRLSETTGLFGTVSDCRVTFLTCKHSHTPLEQQNLVVAPCKHPHLHLGLLSGGVLMVHCMACLTGEHLSYSIHFYTMQLSFHSLQVDLGHLKWPS